MKLLGKFRRMDPLTLAISVGGTTMAAEAHPPDFDRLKKATSCQAANPMTTAIITYIIPIPAFA